MRILAAPAARAFVLSWLVLGTVQLLGRVALMAASWNIDLRLPSFFELVVLAPLEAAVLLWVLRLWRAPAIRSVLATSLRHTGSRRALVAGALAAVAVIVARVLGLDMATVRHDSRIAYGVFVVVAAAVAGHRLSRAATTAERVDWALAALFAGVVGSNALTRWLDVLAVQSLPAGVGAPVAYGVSTCVGVLCATALAMRLDRRAGSEAAALLWSGLAVFLASTAVRFMAFLFGYAIEPWSTLAVFLLLLAAGLGVAGLLLDPVHATLPKDARSPSSTALPPWWRTWLVLVLVHVALSVVMTFVLFDEWVIDGLRLTSWVGITGVQAAVLTGLSRLSDRRSTASP